MSETTPETQSSEGEGAETRTFTQADVERIIGDRLARERQKYADYDELKKKASDFDALKDAEKTELERAAETLAERERQIADLSRRYQEAQVRGAVIAASSARGAVDADAVSKLLDWSAIEFGEDGSPQNVENLVEKLLEDKPYLRGSSKPYGSADGGPRGTPSQTQTDMDALLRAAALGRT